MNKRVGIYFWAGPGTIRMIRTKYGEVAVDEKSFLEAYTEQNISLLKELFSVTDAWISCSWGFSDAVENEDFQFFQDSLTSFQSAGIRTHAYIQGFNLVAKQHTKQDYWCRDVYGNTIPYSPNRLFTCPNNPYMERLLLQRVEKACQTSVSGIYVDNILFGFPPWFQTRKTSSFYGCCCKYCDSEFFLENGFHIVESFLSRKRLSTYNIFRVNSTAAIIRKISSICKKYKKELGINLTDPVLRDASIYYGYDLKKIDPFLDYYLIENHNLPGCGEASNRHLQQLIHETKKPVFVVSYNKGIGDEERYSQQNIDDIFSESAQLGHCVCLKATEFTTKNVWHTIRINEYQSPKITSSTPHVSSKDTQNYFQYPDLLYPFLHTVEPFILKLLYFVQSHQRTYRYLHKNYLYKQILKSERGNAKFE